MTVRIVHHAKGYAALLRDPKILADLSRRAERIAQATGDEDIVAETSDPIRRRNRAAVIAPMGDPDNKIIRALDAGR